MDDIACKHEHGSTQHNAEGPPFGYRCTACDCLLLRSTNPARWVEAAGDDDATD